MFFLKLYTYFYLEAGQVHIIIVICPSINIIYIQLGQFEEKT